MEGYCNAALLRVYVLKPFALTELLVKTAVTFTWAASKAFAPVICTMNSAASCGWMICAPDQVTTVVDTPTHPAAGITPATAPKTPASAVQLMLFTVITLS